jgi:Zn ribbon nucleic-acid-binding protein
MIQSNRFQDDNKVLADFYQEVWVICPSCEKKAIAKVNFENKTARLLCLNCGYNKETSTELMANGTVKMAAHQYFNAELWLKATFKNEVFWALNDKHLEYLERYISATLREHKDRTHFTLLEKLPKFYHEAKNRDDLLKIITKLKNK